MCQVKKYSFKAINSHNQVVTILFQIVSIFVIINITWNIWNQTLMLFDLQGQFQKEFCACYYFLIVSLKIVIIKQSFISNLLLEYLQINFIEFLNFYHSNHSDYLWIKYCLTFKSYAYPQILEKVSLKVMNHNHQQFKSNLQDFLILMHFYGLSYNYHYYSLSLLQFLIFQIDFHHIA